MRYVMGIDEVGRGSLAGPVTVAAVAAPARATFRTANPKLKLRDSKRLSSKQREEWFSYFRAYPRVSYAIARVYPRTIERINIARAANLAALRVFHKLSKSYWLSPKNCTIYLDGGLYLGSKGRIQGAKTVTNGDEKITAIKIASIIAKVNRDRLMKRLSKKYPSYGFEIHKGYGTRHHFKMIKKYGPSEAHRLTFLPKSHKITKS